MKISKEQMVAKMSQKPKKISLFNKIKILLGYGKKG